MRERISKGDCMSCMQEHWKLSCVFSLINNCHNSKRYQDLSINHNLFLAYLFHSVIILIIISSELMSTIFHEYDWLPKEIKCDE